MKRLGTGCTRKGISVKVSKLNSLYESLDDTFTIDDVLNSLDKYRGLTKTPCSTGHTFVWEMRKLKWITNTTRNTKKALYKKIKK